MRNIVDRILSLRATHENRTGRPPAVLRLGVRQQLAILGEWEAYTAWLDLVDAGPPAVFEAKPIRRDSPLVSMHGMSVEPVFQENLLAVGTPGRWPEWTSA